MPYGLTNASPCFQGYINKYLSGLRDLKYTVYLGGIMTYGKTFEEQLENLEAVSKYLKSTSDKTKYGQM